MAEPAYEGLSDSNYLRLITGSAGPSPTSQAIEPPFMMAGASDAVMCLEFFFGDPSDGQAQDWLEQWSTEILIDYLISNVKSRALHRDSSRIARNVTAALLDASGVGSPRQTEAERKKKEEERGRGRDKHPKRNARGSKAPAPRAQRTQVSLGLGTKGGGRLEDVNDLLRLWTTRGETEVFVVRSQKQTSGTWKSKGRDDAQGRERPQRRGRTPEAVRPNLEALGVEAKHKFRGGEAPNKPSGTWNQKVENDSGVSPPRGHERPRRLDDPR
nr:hypothetical protein Iba_chr04aCG17550 [Ipomoea batatas]